MVRTIYFGIFLLLLSLSVYGCQLQHQLGAVEMDPFDWGEIEEAQI